jgi:T5SS/PEP-CTERM-associated repeat protein
MPVLRQAFLAALRYFGAKSLFNPLWNMLFCVLLLLAGTASAQVWTGGTGSWFDLANWSSGFVPGSGHHPEINNAGTAQITQAGALTSGFSLGRTSGTTGTLEISGAGVLGTNGSVESYVGHTGTGNLNITSGGKLNAYRIGFGVFANPARGNGTINGTGSLLTLTDGIYVGFTGEGHLFLQNSGSVTGGNFITIGRNANSSGEVSIDNGVLNSPAAQLSVGQSGLGTLQISNGSTMTSGVAAIAVNTTAGGSAATVDGAAWTSTGFIATGYGANGSLTIQNGGTVQNTDGHVGLLSSGNGTVNVTGANSKWKNAARLFIAGGTTSGTSRGTLNVSNSALVTAGTLLKLWNSNAQVNQLDNSRIVVSTDTNSLPTAGGLHVGAGAGTGTVDVLGGSQLNTTTAYIARDVNSTGTVNILGANSKWSVADSLFIAGGAFDGGTGTLNVQDGGFVAVGSLLKIWNDGQLDVDLPGNNTARLRVSSDVLSPPPTEAGFYVGSSTSPGVVEIVGGGELDTGGPWGIIDGLAGTLISVDGQGSEWDLPATLVIGNDDYGEVRIKNGGHVGHSGTVATIGQRPGSTGGVTVEGTVSGNPLQPSTFNVGALRVGHEGDGRLDIKSGALVTSGESTIASGLSLTGSGTVTVDNAEWKAFRLNVGGLGDGELQITNGGKVAIGESEGQVEGHISVAALTSPEQSLVTVDGANSELVAAGDLTVAVFGTGTLSIKNGAHVDNDEGIIGYHTNSNGTVIVDNATWVNRNALTIGLLGTGLLEIRNGGAVAATGQVRIGSLGTLKGSGAITGTGVTVLVEGTAAPGNSPGTLTIGGNYQQAPTGLLEVELASASSYDVLDISGHASLGGSLQIKLLDGYTPAPNDSFEFLTTASQTGFFNNILVTTSSAGTGTFNIAFSSTGITLSNFQPGGLQGDFNGNHVVDAADYVVWRKSANPSQLEYNLWRANFGRVGGTAGNSSLATGMVPEPDSALLLIVGGVVFLGFREK